MIVVDKIIKGLLDSYGIDQKMVDKVKSIVDNIDVKQNDKTTEITLRFNEVTIILKNKEEEE